MQLDWSRHGLANCGVQVAGGRCRHLYNVTQIILAIAHVYQESAEQVNQMYACAHKNSISTYTCHWYIFVHIIPMEYKKTKHRWTLLQLMSKRHSNYVNRHNIIFVKRHLYSFTIAKYQYRSHYQSIEPHSYLLEW